MSQFSEWLQKKPTRCDTTEQHWIVFILIQSLFLRNLFRMSLHLCIITKTKLH